MFVIPDKKKHDSRAREEPEKFQLTDYGLNELEVTCWANDAVLSLCIHGNSLQGSSHLLNTTSSSVPINERPCMFKWLILVVIIWHDSPSYRCKLSLAYFHVWFQSSGLYDKLEGNTSWPKCPGHSAGLYCVWSSVGFIIETATDYNQISGHVEVKVCEVRGLLVLSKFSDVNILI